MVAGSLIGNKIVVNEFVAFIQRMDVKDALNKHSKAVVTFALCGFANIFTIAILIGGLGSLVPERRSFISQYGFQAIRAGVLADTNWKSIHLARMDNLDVFFGNPSSSHAENNLELDGIGAR